MVRMNFFFFAKEIMQQKMCRRDCAIKIAQKRYGSVKEIVQKRL